MKGRVLIEFDWNDMCMSMAIRLLKDAGFKLIDSNANYKEEIKNEKNI